MRRELPKHLCCCEAFAKSHRDFCAQLEKESSRLLVVTTRYSRRVARCIWCGATDDAIGIKIINPPKTITNNVKKPTANYYIGVDVIEIDEGEYDATKPPAYFPEET
jgi:hypothetical protein